MDILNISSVMEGDYYIVTDSGLQKQTNKMLKKKQMIPIEKKQE